MATANQVLRNIHRLTGVCMRPCVVEEFDGAEASGGVISGVVDTSPACLANHPDDDSWISATEWYDKGERRTPNVKLDLVAGASMGVGSLPHRDAVRAGEFALHATAIPTIPSLPHRSPAEGMIAQAVVGIDGIGLGQYGSLRVDLDALDPEAPVITDLRHDAFMGLRTFLDLMAPNPPKTVKWQFTGPVTLGTALLRAGAPTRLAFPVAVRAVKRHVLAILDEVARRLPGVDQIVVIDEPDLASVSEPGFALAPDLAVDLISAALAVVEPVALAGVHCCHDVDIATLLAAGPDLISVPVGPSLASGAGYLAPFLDRGGTIAWGAVATDGPIPSSVERPWRRLAELWCGLANAGCDPAALRTQSLITPACGLGLHSVAVAERVFDLVDQISARVGDQAAATRITFGA